MKTLFAAIGVITALLVGSVSVMAFAGHRNIESGHGQHRVEKMIERLGGKLDLSDGQKAQLQQLGADSRPVLGEGRSMMKELRQEMMSFDTLGADYQTRMIQLADEQAEKRRQLVLQLADIKLQVAEILNDEQLVKLQELSNQFGDRRMVNIADGVRVIMMVRRYHHLQSDARVSAPPALGGAFSQIA